MKLKPDLLLLFSGLILILLLPWQLIPYNVDNAWYLSMYYNPLVKNLPPDITFGSGNGALPWFGKSLIPLYSLWFGSFGWDLLPALLVSRLFLFLGGWMFFAAFLKSGLSRFSSVALTLGLMASEPVLLAGGFIRPESFLFLMTGFMSLLVLSGHRFIPVLLSFLCLEIHPAAVLLIPFIWILIYRFGVINNTVIPKVEDPATGGIQNPYKNNDGPNNQLKPNLQNHIWRFLVINIISGSLAIAYYLILHPATVSGFIGNIQGGVAATSGTALTQLFNFRLQLPGNEGYNLVWSRIVEIICWLLLLLGVFWVSWKNKMWFPPVLIGWILLADFINPKGNQHYTVYYAIFLVWGFSELIRKKNILLPALAGLTILVFSLWKIFYVAGHSESIFAFSERVEQTQNLKNGKLTKSSVILGSPEAWFIYRDNRFYASAYTGLLPELPDTVFLTKEPAWENPPAGFQAELVSEKLKAGTYKIDSNDSNPEPLNTLVRNK
ncbi:MAG: hypothetical protein J0L62_10880 [Bacteroidetes bacterium]|nr:hypothetical protein [Bacteroidota bacterium]